MKIITVIGARPQIIKAAALSRAIKNYFSDKLQEVIVHTGQHYDERMSRVFFDELEIPEPHYNLAVGSSSHGKQTAAMISGLEEIILKEEPRAVILYGDTNSTLAGAIAASKLMVPIVHIEAGLRSFNKSMPEEVNRIMCDHVSTLLFSPTETGIKNLLKEGFKDNNKSPYSADNPKIYHCGDVMYDNSIYFSDIADKKSNVLKKLQLTPGNFILSTIHRNNNTDDASRLNSIFSSLQQISEKNSIKIVLPIHPRTNKMVDSLLEKKLLETIKNNQNFIITEPASFLDMITLEKNCSLVITDSGGVQKEAFYFKKHCIILRPETEWVELTNCGAAIIADADKEIILSAYDSLSKKTSFNYPSFYGNGKAAEFICEEIIKLIQ